MPEELVAKPAPKKRGRKPKNPELESKISGKVDKDNFALALSEIEKDSSVTRENVADILVSAMEQAYLEWSYPGLYRDKDNNDVVKQLIHCKVVIADDISNFKIYDTKIVTEEDDIVDDAYQVSLEDAKAVNPDAELGQQIDLPFDVTLLDKSYVRRVKQLFQAKLKEASKQAILANFSKSIGELLEGTVTRIESRPARRSRESDSPSRKRSMREEAENHIYELSFGRSTNGLLRLYDQIPGDTFTIGSTVTVLLNDISDKSTPPSLSITRTSEKFILKLLERAVPEIEAGLITIKAIAREAGNKTKIFVESKNPNIDPVGTVIGPESSRLREVTKHLNNEKIDVLKYENNKALQIIEALKPAKIVGLAFTEDHDFFNSNVHFDEIEREKGYQFPKVTAIVEKANFGSAIGKLGVNVRLASRITMCTISIMTSDDAITEGVQYMFTNDIEEEAQKWAIAVNGIEPTAPVVEEVKAEAEDETNLLEEVTLINQAPAFEPVKAEKKAKEPVETENVAAPKANPTSTTSELKNQAQEVEHVEIKNKPKFSLEEFEQAMAPKKGPAITKSTRRRRQDDDRKQEEEESLLKNVQAMPIYTEEELEQIKAQELEDLENDDYGYDEELEEEYGSEY